MHITKFQAENVKRLKVVAIDCDGRVINVGGENEQGKSSVLDAIMYALAGTSAIPPQALRTGTKNGHVTLTLDDGTIVTRKFGTNKDGEPTTTLDIRRKNGDKVTSPQAMLDELCSRISFDPLEFSRLKPKQQLESLKELVGLDFSKDDAERARIYTHRAEVNRQLKAKQAELAACPKVEGVPAEEVSVAELAEKLESMEAVNRSNAEFNRLWDAAGEKLNKARAEVQRLESLLAVAKKAVEAANKEVEVYERTAPTNQDLDTTAIREQIKTADETNRKVRQNEKHFALTHEVADLQSESDSLTASINEIDAAKQAKLKAAKFPVKGMSFDENGILLDGLPLEQASSRGKIKTSVAMGLALNPTLRVMLIREGSLLDDKGLKMVAELAEEYDAQLWIERVSTGEECTVVLEEGSVKVKKPELVA